MDQTGEHFVVVGSGLAGFGAVRELRRLAPGAAITVLTRDDGHFYSKPAISTALAKGKLPAELVTMNADKMIATQRIDLRVRTHLERIEPSTKILYLAGGDAVDYDALILATGAMPIRPKLTGNAADAYFCVNTLDDYVRFRDQLFDGARVAIIGSGLVGTEFANDLTACGHAVAVIDPLAAPLGQLVPPEVGEAVRGALAANGVDWHLGRSAAAIDRDKERYRVTLSDGTTVDADVVLCAIGLRPAVSLARDANLSIDRGILVDDFGRTSDPAIFALGDCAQYPHGTSAYVTPIMTAARAVAATATGSPTAMAFPPLSVQVKTTACPLVLLPAPPGMTGSWSHEESGAGGVKYFFRDVTGAIFGYAMTGDYCAGRATLDKEIGEQRQSRQAA